MQGDIERKESWHVIIEEDVVQIYLLFFQNYVQLYLSKMTATDTKQLTQLVYHVTSASPTRDVWSDQRLLFLQIKTVRPIYVSLCFLQTSAPDARMTVFPIYVL